MKCFVFATVCVCLFAGVTAADPTITGDYLEVRTADIYTGPCFANGEVNLAGREAILAWRIRSGSWEGVPLEGLSVVAVVKASATLGDPHSDPFPAKTVMIIDEQAATEQRRALVDFARAMTGELLDDVVRTESVPIEFETGMGHGHASLSAGKLAGFETRSLHNGDHFCGNEIVYYPPLADVMAHPAYTQSHWYNGEGLNSTWSNPFKRSAFIGTFSR
jgi:hypothetical protein